MMTCADAAAVAPVCHCHPKTVTTASDQWSPSQIMLQIVPPTQKMGGSMSYLDPVPKNWGSVGYAVLQSPDL